MRPNTTPMYRKQPQKERDVVTIGMLWTSRHGVPSTPVPSGTQGKLVRTFRNDDGEQLVHVRVAQGLIVCAAKRVQATT